MSFQDDPHLLSKVIAGGINLGSWLWSGNKTAIVTVEISAFAMSKEGQTCLVRFKDYVYPSTPVPAKALCASWIHSPRPDCPWAVLHKCVLQLEEELRNG